MVFAPGVRARVKLSNGVVLVAGAVQPQPPLLGVVQKVENAPPGPTDDLDVLMEDGRLLTVERQFLDELSNTAALLRNLYIDKVVNGQDADGVSYSSEYTGRVVDVYDVDGATRVLIRSLSNGMYYELPYTLVNTLGDR